MIRVPNSNEPAARSYVNRQLAADRFDPTILKRPESKHTLQSIQDLLTLSPAERLEETDKLLSNLPKATYAVPGDHKGPSLTVDNYLEWTKPRQGSFERDDSGYLFS
ncbi:MAG: hypothetical protein KC800_33735 [Candidatus Eremiobacteraeota bacterium]|nr:hypothetical protein [Candidatus Eremiobacteraeota bacterium]